MSGAEAFLDRVFQHAPRTSPGDYTFKSWRYGDRPTSEGFGLLPARGLHIDKAAACVMDVDAYVGNIDFVDECRSIADKACARPRQVRFYERIKVPVLAEIQMELVLTDFGERDGYRVLAWHQLDAETGRLDPKKGARSEYNVGAWLFRPDAIGYALSSAPRRDDVGRLKYAALTKGADAGAAQVVKANLQGMLAWSMRR